ncbi:Alpha/Beta hydrolase fold,Peptidase S28 [Cinara cedri]|uniref:Alpha/Beta hydrolase fold,Peptidase S28 n=1 Tax=Cinara cedri TaxID=506608 RepID=A0A5E4NRK4_9HEMI|nr:Alpha/Beta hydrolase fold,Peptidase S28 [Cinara cedri]
MKFLFCMLWCVVFWWNSPASCIKKHNIGLGVPNIIETSNTTIEDKWFVQILDHFNPTDNRTWEQRYQVNQEYYKEGGPVFLMIGGEGPISKRWMVDGSWIEYAQEFNALSFQLEHRYYGSSIPTENITTDNLVYLSSEQALADLARFIINIQSEYEIPSTTKWVAFGGSYAGSLAAWLRLKYPHLVHIAVSSSGPLLAKIDFQEYFKVVENSLSTYKHECVTKIKRANEIINVLLKTHFGTNLVAKKFKLCQPLNKSNKKDVANLFESLADNFADIVQYNKDNRHYYNYERSLVTIETLCDIMLDKSIPDSLDRYAAVNSKMLSIYGLNCLDHVYDNMIEFYQETSWDSDAAESGSRQWIYQTCTEFGFYQTSSQDNHVFGHNFPVEFFIDMCTDIFGKSFNLDLLTRAVDRTNMIYGELNIKEDRTIYVQGSIDPWHALGITKTRTNNTVSIYIDGTAHCANMYPSTPTDPPQLTEARTTIKEYLNEWLIESDW